MNKDKIFTKYVLNVYKTKEEGDMKKEKESADNKIPMNILNRPYSTVNTVNEQSLTTIGYFFSATNKPSIMIA